MKPWWQPDYSIWDAMKWRNTYRIFNLILLTTSSMFAKDYKRKNKKERYKEKTSDPHQLWQFTLSYAPHFTKRRVMISTGGEGEKDTEQVSCRVSLWLEELSWNAVVTVTSSGQHRALAFPGLLLNPTPCTWVQEAAGDTAGITGRKNSSALAKGKRMSQHHQETKQRQLEAKEAASAEELKHGNTCNGTASQFSLQLGNTSFHNCPWGWWGEDQRWIKTLWSTHSLHLRRRNRFQTWMTLWWHPTPNNCLIWWKILRIPND